MADESRRCLRAAVRIARHAPRRLPPRVPAPAPGRAFPRRRGPAEARSPPAAPTRSGGLRALRPAGRRSSRRSATPAKWGYDYFVEGRFLVSTDDAYVGADTAIIAAKAAGHLLQVPVVDNQVVHQGDLLALIDDGDYRLAVDAAQAKVDTQDATIARFGRQIDAQAAVIAQAEAQVEASQAQLRSAEADAERAALEYDRSAKLAQTNFGSQQRLEQATADRARTSAAIAGAQGERGSAPPPRSKARRQRSTSSRRSATRRRASATS